MKTPFKFLALFAVIAFSFAPILVRAQDVPPPPDDQSDQGDQGDQGASFQTFYDQLGDQGTWVQTDDYGYVFQPNVTDPNWAPYTNGHWVYTDVGWTWVSDEPWGWATYHYGRWANIDGMGWVWVPGYEWAPAWVSWRYGGGYCGWAPLPPETFIGAEYGDRGGWSTFHFGSDVDVNFNIGAGCYNFVRIGDMGERNYRGRYLDRSRNFTVINNTTNITNININRAELNNGARNFRGVSVGGPTIGEVNAHSRTHIQTVQLMAANAPGRSAQQGNSLAVFAPRVNPTTQHQARPAQVSQTLAHPTFNRGDSITRPLAVTASVRPAAPSAQAIQAAQTAQLHAPNTARIATERTQVKTPITAPLSSLAPTAAVHHTATTTSPGVNQFNSNAQHSPATAPYTGQSVNHPYTPPGEVKPTQTYHPQTEASPAPTYHPSNTPSVQTYHPQTQANPAPTYHPSNTPSVQTYHPQTQANPAPTYHPSNTPPAQVYHTPAPTETYHPQVEQSHPSTPPAQAYHAPAEPAHSAAPAPAQATGGKPAAAPGTVNKQQPGQ